MSRYRVFVFFVALLCFNLLFISCQKKDKTPEPEPPSNTGNGLGDNQDFKFGTLRSTSEELAKIPILQSTDTASIPILSRTQARSVIEDFTIVGNQNPYGSCAAWVVGYGLMSYFYHKMEKNAGLYCSPQFIYNFYNKGADNGLSLANALLIARQQGTISFSPLSQSFKLGTVSDQDLIFSKDYTLSDVLRLPKNYLPFLKVCLDRKRPVVFSFRPDDGFMNTNYDAWDNFQENNVEQFIWKRERGSKKGDLHSLVIIGYDDIIGAFKVQNSWGVSKWGAGGIAWISYEMFDKVLVRNDDDPEIYIAFPRVATTLEVMSMQTKAEIKAETYNTGFFVPKTRGICYSEKELPTISDSYREETGGQGEYKLEINQLKAGTTYYVRSYAFDGSRTLYGNQRSFKTTEASKPIVTTTPPAAITVNSALVGGIINSDGGANIIDKGIVYSVDPNFATPISVGSGSGSNSFSTTLNGLLPSKKYFVKAYATNSVGTMYGNETSFTTLSGPIGLNQSIWEGYYYSSQYPPDQKLPAYLKLSVGNNLNCVAGWSNGPGNYTAVSFNGLINSSGTSITWDSNTTWEFDSPWSISDNTMTGTVKTCLTCNNVATYTFTLTKK